MTTNIYGTVYVKSEGAHCLNYGGSMTREQALAELDRLNAKPEPMQTVQFDFDGGFGIGGINRAQEMPIVPTPEQIGRYNRAVETDVVCKVCGASKHFGGAMFCNGGGDICNDCF